MPLSYVDYTRSIASAPHTIEQAILSFGRVRHQLLRWNQRKKSWIEVRNLRSTHRSVIESWGTV